MTYSPTCTEAARQVVQSFYQQHGRPPQSTQEIAEAMAEMRVIYYTPEYKAWLAEHIEINKSAPPGVIY
jgi:hypothetical protein